MPELQPGTTELKAQYTAQVTADLEHNAREQQRIHDELAALEGQLEALQRNHAVLLTVRQALAAQAGDGAAAPARKRGAAKTKAAGKDAPSAPGAGKKSGSAEAKAGHAKTTKPAAPQPTLGELIRDILAQQTEPKSIAEIAAALAQAHPDRGVKATVVRNTVENLVARAQVERHKQGGSVFYTTVSASKDEQEPAAEKTEPVSETPDAAPSVLVG
ncbi:hypothetical protein [Yinghuangia sp. YIM S10712]|uniref:hypothetical protein n=1 Tax=Yinghuangia sp. YIM S10712 TaxID=3436930 RepID=UPI003F538679